MTNLKRQTKALQRHCHVSLFPPEFRRSVLSTSADRYNKRSMFLETCSSCLLNSNFCIHIISHSAHNPGVVAQSRLAKA